MQPYKARNCKVIPRMEILWLRPLLTGGSLKATRAPSCAAAAEGSVTFDFFRWNLRRLGEGCLIESGRMLCASTKVKGKGQGPARLGSRALQKKSIFCRGGPAMHTPP